MKSLTIITIDCPWHTQLPICYAEVLHDYRLYPIMLKMMNPKNTLTTNAARALSTISLLLEKDCLLRCAKWIMLIDNCMGKKCFLAYCTRLVIIFYFSSFRTQNTHIDQIEPAQNQVLHLWQTERESLCQRSLLLTFCHKNTVQM